MTRLVYELSYYDESKHGYKLLELALVAPDGKWWKKYTETWFKAYKVSKKLDNLIRKKSIELDLMNYFNKLGYNFLAEIVLCDHYDMWFNKIEIVGTPHELTHYKMRYQ